MRPTRKFTPHPDQRFPVRARQAGSKTNEHPQRSPAAGLVIGGDGLLPSALRAWTREEAWHVGDNDAPGARRHRLSSSGARFQRSSSGAAQER